MQLIGRYGRHVAGMSLLSRSALLIGAAAVLLAAAGCSGPGKAATHPAPASVAPGPPVTEQVANGRFTVLLSGQAVQAARAAGIDLPGLVSRALNHISVLLPGPKTSISVNYYRPGVLIPQTGTAGVTTLQTGRIVTGFGRTARSTISRAVAFWLPRTLSHEVDHSVRILAGPGFGPTLLDQIISEGISSVFDEAAFPGPPNPWDNAISRSQECTMWRKAQSMLAYTGLYDLWMFGSPGVPYWTGFTIGYHIVKDYRLRHPHLSWAALTRASATTILTGSYYHPCTEAMN